MKPRWLRGFSRYHYGNSNPRITGEAERAPAREVQLEEFSRRGDLEAAREHRARPYCSGSDVEGQPPRRLVACPARMAQRLAGG